MRALIKKSEVVTLATKESPDKSMSAGTMESVKNPFGGLIWAKKVA